MTCDPSTGRIEAALKDGGGIQIAVWDMPAFFRWPRQDEVWSVQMVNGIWRLGNLIQSRDQREVTNALEPGEARISADVIRAEDGRPLVVCEIPDTDGLVVAWDNGTKQWEPRAVSGGGDPALGAHEIQDEGTSLTPRSALNFVGFTVTDDVANDRTNVEAVAGGGGPPTGPAGGVLSGSYPDPTFATDMATQAEVDTALLAAKDRANHTGTQIAATISDFVTEVRANRLDEMAVPTGPVSFYGGTLLLPGIAIAGDPNTGIASTAADQLSFITGGTSRLGIGTTTATFTVPLSMNSKKITALAAGTATTDAVNKSQMDTADTASKARANHTGTQLAATISDFVTEVRVNRLNEMAAPAASVSMGSQRITSLADAIDPTDGVNLQQVQAMAGESVVAGDGLLRTGDTLSVRLTSGLKFDVDKNITLSLSPINPGLANGGGEQLRAHTDEVTIERSASGLRVKAGGITEAHLADNSVNLDDSQGTITGTLGIANGGTGATDAAGARAALGISDGGSGDPADALLRTVRVRRQAAQPVNHAAHAAISWDAEDYDDDALHNPASNPARVTIDRAGKYGLAAGVHFAASNIGGYRYARIMKNGVTELVAINVPPSPVAQTIVPLSTTAALAAGDYVEVTAYQDTGAALNVVAASLAVTEVGVGSAGGGGTPEAWRTVGAPGQPTFLNGWSSPPDQPVQFCKMPDGTVRLRGLVLAGGPDGMEIFQLPSTHRQPIGVVEVFSAVTDTGMAVPIEINYGINGQVIPLSPVDPGASWFSLSGISFPTH